MIVYIYVMWPEIHAFQRQNVNQRTRHTLSLMSSLLCLLLVGYKIRSPCIMYHTSAILSWVLQLHTMQCFSRTSQQQLNKSRVPNQLLNLFFGKVVFFKWRLHTRLCAHAAVIILEIVHSMNWYLTLCENFLRSSRKKSGFFYAFSFDFEFASLVRKMKMKPATRNLWTMSLSFSGLCAQFFLRKKYLWAACIMFLYWQRSFF